MKVRDFIPVKHVILVGIRNKARRKKSSFQSTISSREYQIKDFISCRTEGVVFFLECPCRVQYVGRTKRELWKRLRENTLNLKNDFPKHSLSRHYDQFHNRDPSSLLVWGIEKYKPHWRGNNKVIKCSQSESRWIHELLTLVPLGHNVEFDLNCFISNY